MAWQWGYGPTDSCPCLPYLSWIAYDLGLRNQDDAEIGGKKIMKNLFLWAIRFAGLVGFIAVAAGGLRVFNYGREFAGQFSLAAGMILMCGAFTVSRLLQPRD